MRSTLARLSSEGLVPSRGGALSSGGSSSSTSSLVRLQRKDEPLCLRQNRTQAAMAAIPEGYLPRESVSRSSSSHVKKGSVDSQGKEVIPFHKRSAPLTQVRKNEYKILKKVQRRVMLDRQNLSKREREEKRTSSLRFHQYKWDDSHTRKTEAKRGYQKIMQPKITQRIKKKTARGNFKLGGSIQELLKLACGNNADSMTGTSSDSVPWRQLEYQTIRLLSGKNKNMLRPWDTADLAMAFGRQNYVTKDLCQAFTRLVLMNMQGDIAQTATNGTGSWSLGLGECGKILYLLGTKYECIAGSPGSSQKLSYTTTDDFDLQHAELAVLLVQRLAECTSELDSAALGSVTFFRDISLITEGIGAMWKRSYGVLYRSTDAANYSLTISDTETKLNIWSAAVAQILNRKLGGAKSQASKDASKAAIRERIRNKLYGKAGNVVARATPEPTIDTPLEEKHVLRIIRGLEKMSKSIAKIEDATSTVAKKPRFLLHPDGVLTQLDNRKKEPGGSATDKRNLSNPVTLRNSCRRRNATSLKAQGWSMASAESATDRASEDDPSNRPNASSASVDQASYARDCRAKLEFLFGKLFEELLVARSSQIVTKKNAGSLGTATNILSLQTLLLALRTAGSLRLRESILEQNSLYRIAFLGLLSTRAGELLAIRDVYDSYRLIDTITTFESKSLTAATRNTLLLRLRGMLQDINGYLRPRVSQNLYSSGAQIVHDGMEEGDENNLEENVSCDALTTTNDGGRRNHTVEDDGLSIVEWEVDQGLMIGFGSAKKGNGVSTKTSSSDALVFLQNPTQPVKKKVLPDPELSLLLDMSIPILEHGGRGPQHGVNFRVSTDVNDQLVEQMERRARHSQMGSPELVHASAEVCAKLISSQSPLAESNLHQKYLHAFVQLLSSCVVTQRNPHTWSNLKDVRKIHLFVRTLSEMENPSKHVENLTTSYEKILPSLRPDFFRSLQIRDFPNRGSLPVNSNQEILSLLKFWSREHFAKKNISKTKSLSAKVFEEASDSRTPNPNLILLLDSICPNTTSESSGQNRYTVEVYNKNALALLNMLAEAKSDAQINDGRDSIDKAIQSFWNLVLQRSLAQALQGSTTSGSGYCSMPLKDSLIAFDCALRILFVNKNIVNATETSETANEQIKHSHPKPEAAMENPWHAGREMTESNDLITQLFSNLGNELDFRIDRLILTGERFFCDPATMRSLANNPDLIPAKVQTLCERYSQFYSTT